MRSLLVPLALLLATLAAPPAAAVSVDLATCEDEISVRCVVYLVARQTREVAEVCEQVKDIFGIDLARCPYLS